MKVGVILLNAIGLYLSLSIYNFNARQSRVKQNLIFQQNIKRQFFEVAVSFRSNSLFSLSVCPSVYLSVCPSVYLSVCFLCTISFSLLLVGLLFFTKDAISLSFFLSLFYSSTLSLSLSLSLSHSNFPTFILAPSLSKLSRWKIQSENCWKLIWNKIFFFFF